MDPEQLYAAFSEKLRNSPSNPGDQWLSELAQILYRMPLSIEEFEAWDDSATFSFMLLGVLGGEWRPKMSTVEDQLDYLIANHLGIQFLLPNRFKFWELPHGEVLAWRLYGTPKPPRFWNAPVDTDKREVLETAEMFWAGAPSDEMLPPLVRKALKWAMRERLHISKPKVGLIQRSTEPGISRVVPSLNPSELGGEAQAADAFKRLVWYVPTCIPMLHVPSMAEADWMVEL